jgi:outer membrane protein assembly factor BamB
MDDVGLSMTGALLGTPRYMSPEQASATRLPVDQRTDIYSLGATLYELATGKPLFDADTPHGVITQILTTEPLPPRRVRTDLPRDLETIIIKCLSKEPAKRYDTAQALADDLRAFAEGRAIKARRAGPVERTLRWVRRQRRTVGLAAAAAAIAVAVVLGSIASWWAYGQSRLGHISLTTEGPSLTAEVLDEESDEPVVPSMAVPSQEPVALKEGRYRLRLSASGLLSETWPLEVQRGSQSSLDVRLHSQWLWPPMNILNEARPPEPVDLMGRTDFISVQTVARDGNATVAVRRLDGSTGKPAWPADLEFNETTLPQSGDLRLWRSVLDRGLVPNAPQSLLATLDLNGDGTRDLVWASRTSASLVAVSGKDGKPLWWFLGHAAPQSDSRTGESSDQGRVLGLPATAEIDGDSTPDLIACFLSSGERYRTENGVAHTGARAWVEAVSGRTGKSLWRHDLSQSRTRPFSQLVTHLLYSGDSSRRDDLVCRPTIAHVRGKPVVVMAFDRLLLGMDLRTGKEAWPVRDLGLDLLRSPQIGDLDSDGRPDALLTSRDASNRVVLAAQRLDDGEAIWTYSSEPFHNLSHLAAPARDWPLVADSSGEGRPVVVVSALHDSGWRDRWAGIEVLDGATGEVRWQRPLLRSGMYQPTPVHRMIDGPDLDGDGCREVFVAFSGQDQGGRSALTVAALSGADGRTLWRWKRAVPHVSPSDTAAPLRWWHAGVDGWPQLVVPIDKGPGSQPMTFILSAATGRLAYTLPEVADPRLADVNGDRVADIFYHQASTTGSESYGKLAVLRGDMPEPWRRLGRWTPAQDFDGDGSVDLLGEDGTARSGEDGRVLWRVMMRHSTGEPLSSPPPPQGDLDGDGTPDVLAFEHVWRTVPNAFTSGWAVSAFSGKDGRNLWTSDFGMSGGRTSGRGAHGEYSYPCLDCWDLDQGGRAHVLAAYAVSGSSEIMLAVLSGRDGTLLWQAPIVADGSPLGSARHRPQMADLDGDGTLDLLMCAPNTADASRQTVALVALSGRDGRAIWPPSAVIVQSVNSGPVRAAAGDLDGDGSPEAVMIRTDRDATGRQVGRLMTLNGRDGRVKWTWSWAKESHVRLPPLLVDFDGEGRKSVCAYIYEKGQWQIVVLGPDGQVRGRIPLKVPAGRSYDLENAVPWWAPCDLDADGREEVLCISDGQLVASRGPATASLWKWPVPAEDSTVLEVRPSGKGRPAIVVAQAGRTVYGLSGLTGRPLWRCAAGQGPVSVLWSSDPAVPPRVGTQGATRAWSTVFRQAWPTGPDGHYVPGAPMPVSYDPQRAEEVRPLPWTARDRDVLLTVPTLGALCLLLVGAPGLLVSWAARRDRWALGLLAVACGMLGILLTSCFPDSDVMLGTSVLVALAVPGQLGYWALRRQSLQLHLLVLTAVAVVLGAFLYGYRPSPLLRTGPLLRSVQACAVALGMAVAALPVAALLGLCIVCVRRGQWARIGWLLGLSVVLSVALAALMLAWDAQDKDPSEHYAWNGWYMIWPLGAYTAGAMALVGLGLKTGFRLLQRAIRRREDHTGLNVTT